MRNIRRRKTNEQFLKELSEKHPTLEALEEYVTNRQKIHLRCKVCGYILYVQPLSLYSGHGCGNCGGTRKKTHEEFVKIMEEKRPDIEILGEYTGNHDPIKVRCKNCDRIYELTPIALLNRNQCARCYGTERKTHEDFVSEMKNINPDLRIIGTYYNNRSLIEYYCEKCKETHFAQAHSLLTYGGCNHNPKSRGEQKISDWLAQNNISFIKEYSFSDCRDQNALPFDFYLPEHNILIEFDGAQHYKPVDYFGGQDAFEKVQLHDSIKTKYCLDNNIKLIRIPYWDYCNIDIILNSELNK